MTAVKQNNDILTVNRQITDAITQSNILATGLSPAHSMGTLYQTLAQSMGTSFQNSISNQQNVNSLNLAALSQNIQHILQNSPARNTYQTLQPIVLQPTFTTPVSSGEKGAGKTRTDI
jgi:hypothetical protein